MARISDLDRARFANLVVKAWSDKDLARRYESDPAALLAQHGIQVPQGVPTPAIPPRPEGDIGKTFQNLPFEHWDVKVEELGPKGGATQISISSLACVACPVSCFSSIAN